MPCFIHRTNKPNLELRYQEHTLYIKVKESQEIRKKHAKKNMRLVGYLQGSYQDARSTKHKNSLNDLTLYVLVIRASHVGYLWSRRHLIWQNFTGVTWNILPHSSGLTFCCTTQCIILNVGNMQWTYLLLAVNKELDLISERTATRLIWN